MIEDILRNEERAIFSLRSLYRNYGYQRYKMSRFEEYELYVRNKDFLVSDEVITFTDRNGRLLALKPDVTLSIIKNTVDHPGVVEKQYYNENVYRIDPGTHSFKEIMQAGLECVGDLTSYEIGEVVMLAVKSLALLGENYVLDISHMGLISAVLEDSGLSENGKKQALVFLRQKSGHELLALCQAEQVPDEGQRKLLALIACSGTAAEVRDQLLPLMTGKAGEALSELLGICNMLDSCGLGDRVNVDFSVGNDMKYYSGVVFKGYLQGMYTSVLSGGQYDKLLRKMGRSSSAIGFAIYVDLLERQGSAGICSDIDTLILHDGSMEIQRLVALTEEASKSGSVLVAASAPEGRTWNRMIRIENGEVVFNG